MQDFTQHDYQLMGFALRLTEHRQDAEDLLQETYAKAVECKSQFQEGTNLRAWLFTIMKHTHMNIGRAKRADKRPKMSRHGMEDWQHPRERSAESVALGKMTDERVKQTMQSLPDIFSRALYLSAVEGYSTREIAEHEGIPEGTVMSRVMRARRKFIAAY